MAGVIRREEFVSAPAFSFQDLELDASHILRQAYVQAGEIVKEARARAAADVERAHREAERSGHAEGRAAGALEIRKDTTETALQEARRNLTQLSEALQAAIAAVERDKCALLAAAESGLIRLALAIARRVCRNEIGRSSSAVEQNARALLHAVRHDHDLVMRLHPDEHALLESALRRFVEQTELLDHVEIVSDETVGRGGCVIVSRDGSVDASIETQLDRIAAALTGSPDAPEQGA